MFGESILNLGVRVKNQVLYTLYKTTKVFKGLEKENSIIVLPHEGLGDLIAILPALQDIEKRGVSITLVADMSKWIQVENAFIDIPKVNLLHFDSNGLYCLPKFLSKSDCSSIISLGFYSNFPVVEYPRSFFWQLGVNQNLVSNFLQPKLVGVNFKLPPCYDFIDLNTSKGRLSAQFTASSKNTVTSLSNTELIVNLCGAEKLLILDVNTSFQQKICLALNADKVTCSDAALFNALIRFERRPKLIVHSRKHRHSHCVEIYQHCKFDGNIYEFSARP